MNLIKDAIDCFKENPRESISDFFGILALAGTAFVLYCIAVCFA